MTLNNITAAKPSLEGTRLLGFVFLSVVLFFTLFGNILICVTILKTRQLQTTSNILIFNMALGDILYSFTTIPLSLVLILYSPRHWPLGKTGNIFFDATWLSFIVLSFLNVTVIACDRYIAIAQPFSYQVRVTKQRVVYVCLSLWFYTTVLIFTITFTFREPNGVTYMILIPGITYYVVLISHASLAFITVPFFYARIYLIARRQRIQIMKLELQRRHRLYQLLKNTWTIGLVIVLFFIVWMPFLINQVVDYASVSSGEWKLMNSVMNYFTYCNGPVNSWIYSCRNRDIRAAIRNMLCKTRVSPISVIQVRTQAIHRDQCFKNGEST